MSAGMPVSSRRTLAALAVGATPKTGRLLAVEVVGGAARVWWSCRCRRGRRRGRAGRRRRRRQRRRPGARRGRRDRRWRTAGAACSWASMAKVRMRSSWARTRSWVRCGSIGAIQIDRPSDERTGSRSTGGSSVDAGLDDPVARRPRPRSPSRVPRSGTRAESRSQTAWSTSARVQDEPLAESCSSTSATVGGLLRRDAARRGSHGGDEAVGRPAESLPLRRSTGRRGSVDGLIGLGRARVRRPPRG